MSMYGPRFAKRTHCVNPSAIREILKVVALPDIISFAGGMPAPDLFPYDGLQAAAQIALSTRPKALASLQYGHSEGYLPLRRQIVLGLESEGIAAQPEQVLMTTGSQQALDMLSKIFIDPGDEVVVGHPTFLGALQSFSSFEARVLSVPLDDEGMRSDALEALLVSHKPKFIYAIPNFQNPTGVSMSPARKVEILAVARRFGVPIIEDDPYGELYFGPDRPHTLKSLDASEGVILMRTFSKVLAPGLRLGYLVLPPEVMRAILPAKQSADLHTSALDQALVYEFLESGAMPAHLAHLRPIYKARRDLMLRALETHFPEFCRWTTPQGGLFIWVTLPTGMSSEALLKAAVARKVAFIPGRPFFADGSGDNTFRLNFSNASEEQIDEGIKRLGEVIRQAAPQELVSP